MKTHEINPTIEIARCLDSIPKVPSVKAMQAHNARRTLKRSVSTDAANAALIAAVTFAVVGWGVFITQPKTEKRPTESEESAITNTDPLATIIIHKTEKPPLKEKKSWAVIKPQRVQNQTTPTPKAEPKTEITQAAKTGYQQPTDEWKSPLVLYESGPLTKSLAEIRSKIWPTITSSGEPTN